jgi:hypothetical protein
MIDFWKGLIAFRKSDPGGVFRRGEAPPEGYYRWVLPDNRRHLGYVVDGRVLVLINADETAGTFSVQLPTGRWLQIGDTETVNPIRGVSGAPVRTSSGEEQTFEVPGPGLQIWLLQSDG